MKGKEIRHIKPKGRGRTSISSNVTPLQLSYPDSEVITQKMSTLQAQVDSLQ